MTIKTTKPQLEGIELILKVLLADNQPANIAEQLVYNHVFKAYTKIRAKIESSYAPRSGYAVSLTDQEALALHVFYENVHIYHAAYQYEALQLQTVFNQINQQYGHINQTDQRNRGLATGTSERRLGGKA